MSAASSDDPRAWSPSFLSHFDTIMFDCDGVLWHETSTIPGAVETLQRLEQMGKRLLFATNNSGKSRDAYVQKFVQLGFTPAITVTPEQIFTSSQAAAYFLSHLSGFDKTKQKVFTVGESGIGLEMRAVGIECIEAMQMFGSRHLFKTDLSQLQVDPSIGCVVVGIDEQMTYTKAAYATACLNQPAHAEGDKNDTLNRKCLFISTNQDSNLPTAGHALPGAGSCVAMVATASGRNPINIGKPESHIMKLAIEAFQLDPARVLMVGDRLDTDILFGIKTGVQTLFVSETGINNRKDVEKFGIRPTFIADDVACMVERADTSRSQGEHAR